MELLNYESALALLLGYKIDLKIVEIVLSEAVGEISAEDIYADRDYPPFNRASMDGIAFNAQLPHDYTKPFNCIDTVYAGSSVDLSLGINECVKIMTGAAVPHSANVVVRIEDCIESENGILCNKIPEKLFLYISNQGEDVSKGELVLNKNTKITPVVSSVLAAIGKAQVNVYKALEIGLISTGNELVDIDIIPNLVQIRDSNRVYLQAFLNAFPVKISFSKHAQDDMNDLKENISLSLQNDITILSGGVSAGEADYVPYVLKELGVKQIFHKVAIKPGKPIWVGTSQQGKLVIGLPGNPLSVQIASKIFIEPLLNSIFGLEPAKPVYLPMASPRKKPNALTEFIPASLLDSKTVQAIKFNGSGDILSACKAQGFFVHKPSQSDLVENSVVPFYFW